MVPYTLDFDKSKVLIMKWSFIDSNSVLVTRRDRSSMPFKSMNEMKNLSTQDLLTIQYLEPKQGSLTNE